MLENIAIDAHVAQEIGNVCALSSEDNCSGSVIKCQNGTRATRTACTDSRERALMCSTLSKAAPSATARRMVLSSNIGCVSPLELMKALRRASPLGVTRSTVPRVAPDPGGVQRSKPRVKVTGLRKDCSSSSKHSSQTPAARRDWSVAPACVRSWRPQERLLAQRACWCSKC